MHDARTAAALPALPLAQRFLLHPLNPLSSTYKCLAGLQPNLLFRRSKALDSLGEFPLAA